MGKWKNYTICTNPSCTYRDKDGHRSWRSYSNGPDCCRHCNTPFRIPAWFANSVSGPSAAGASGSGKSGASGTQGAGQWFSQDSKGRTRPLPKQDSTGLSADEVSKFLQNQCQGDESKLSAVQQLIGIACPPKPKTDAELLSEAAAAVDKATGARKHAEKVFSDMQSKYRRLCTELVEHKHKMDEQAVVLDKAKGALVEAERELMETRAKQFPALPAEASKPTGRNDPLEAFNAALEIPSFSAMDLSRSMLESRSISQTLDAAQARDMHTQVSGILDQYARTMQMAFQKAAAEAFRHVVPSPPPAQSTLRCQVAEGSEHTVDDFDFQMACHDSDANAINSIQFLHASEIPKGPSGASEDELALHELEMDQRESVKREGADESGARPVQRTRLENKQVATAPHSAERSDDQIQAFCNKALETAQAVHAAAEGQNASSSADGGSAAAANAAAPPAGRGSRG